MDRVDTALILAGVVDTVWRGKTVEEVLAKQGEVEGELVAFARTDDGAPEVVPGQLWDGETLSDPPPPPPPRRLLPKSTVTERLRTIGKFAAAWSALLADGDKFDKWFTPTWPNVYADDDGLIAFLQGLGLTPAEIDTVTAP